MGWKRRWPERPPRPEVRSLSSEERGQILDVFRKGIESSPVLFSLNIRVRALRGRFYLERVWQFPGEESEECTFHEALFHFFGIPIDVMAEPRQWYIYHRKPQIIEVSKDRTQVLVEFTSYSMSGPISGICLYAVVDGEWDAFTIKPNQSGDIATAIAWLKKRNWQEW
jgi:hypothetical protein